MATDPDERWELERALHAAGDARVLVSGPPHVQRPSSSAGLDDLLAFVEGPPA